MHAQTIRQPRLRAVFGSCPLQWKRNWNWSFFVPRDTDHDISYLKVFVSTVAFDFSFLEQSSKNNFTDAENIIPPHLIWEVITIPIVVISPNAPPDILSTFPTTEAHDAVMRRIDYHIQSGSQPQHATDTIQADVPFIPTNLTVTPNVDTTDLTTTPSVPTIRSPKMKPRKSQDNGAGKCVLYMRALSYNLR